MKSGNSTFLLHTAASILLISCGLQSKTESHRGSGDVHPAKTCQNEQEAQSKALFCDITADFLNISKAKTCLGDVPAWAIKVTSKSPPKAGTSGCDQFIIGETITVKPANFQEMPITELNGKKIKGSLSTLNELVDISLEENNGQCDKSITSGIFLRANYDAPVDEPTVVIPIVCQLTGRISKLSFPTEVKKNSCNDKYATPGYLILETAKVVSLSATESCESRYMIGASEQFNFPDGIKISAKEGDTVEVTLSSGILKSVVVKNTGKTPDCEPMKLAPVNVGNEPPPDDILPPVTPVIKNKCKPAATP